MGWGYAFTLVTEQRGVGRKVGGGGVGGGAEKEGRGAVEFFFSILEHT